MTGAVRDLAAARGGAVAARSARSGSLPGPLPWVRVLAGVRDRLDTVTLLGLVNEDLWTPDVLTPVPRLGVTTTAVNQHLRALRAGGLLVSARHGRSVLYRRTDLADRLLG